MSISLVAEPAKLAEVHEPSLSKLFEHFEFFWSREPPLDQNKSLSNSAWCKMPSGTKAVAEVLMQIARARDSRHSGTAVWRETQTNAVMIPMCSAQEITDTQYPVFQAGHPNHASPCTERDTDQVSMIPPFCSLAGQTLISKPAPSESHKVFFNSQSRASGSKLRAAVILDRTRLSLPRPGSPCSPWSIPNVTPKGALQPASCHASVTRGNFRASS